MNRLVINTANDTLFIALQIDGKVFSVVNNSKMHHNETMLPLIDGLLKEKGVSIEDINELGVVIGPGSFTGVRVGIATIKAFRDALNIKAKSINNLDYLFTLAQEQDKDIATVAICGSRDSYFVGKFIHNRLYKYERNLTLEELKQVIGNGKVAMFTVDNNLPCVQLEDDAYALLRTLDDSKDETLVPVYYQLSQAENEKLKRGEIVVESAQVEDLLQILEIEKSSISVNTLTEQDVKLALTDENYKTLKVTFNKEIVGFIILQITDEINILSVAVKKEYRNLGLASKLIAQSEKFCKEKQVNTLSLEVNYNNVTAYLLYQKLGFTLRRVRKNYYEDGGDCLEMTKTIN